VAASDAQSGAPALPVQSLGKRAASAAADRPAGGRADRWRQRDQDDLGSFAAHAQHPVAMLFAEVGKVGSGGLEDPQAQQPEHGHQREVVRVW